MSNVKLAIRVRPFTDRELSNEKERVPVVSVIDEKTVAITNVKVSVSGAGDSRERVRRYYADYTFDSACAPHDPAYASQEKVFETIGREVASSVSRGYSACVLAYGQSATGKTHTMMGSEAEPGLVPRLCHALITDQRLEVTASFLEIYNERVHDLLVGESPPTCHSLPRRRGNALKDLRVREHPSRGPYVQNLRRVAVHDVETLLSLVSEGVRRRRTAATRRNSSSSRSHALLELATPTATLHLADLAGSEKASWEGFGGGGGRQKEGANINKSLVALSNVISALVSGGHRGRFVPYRDSALTWLLKDCFTGGASTFIIATVSPSVGCYGESASTLRWAARARQLPSTRPHCTGPTNASRAALQAQLNQLIAELARHHIRYISEIGRLSYGDEHWLLNVHTGTSPKVDSGPEDSKIGNVMNLLNPKTEHRSSESTATSIASTSSDVIDEKGDNVKEEINKEVDHIFGPALERTKSGTDFKSEPLRHKKRQYKSQEILPFDMPLQIYDPKTSKTSPSQSNEQLNETGLSGTKPNIPILHDDQRAEIVASVTERLYTKLKKKEETVVNKMDSIVDRKIMEPLSELRICTNARQRLMELSHKALRNKRRIGIPAHTQTRSRATRVRDQGIDVQTDLQMYVTKQNKTVTIHRDVATETVSMTPRCKEIAVGPVGSLHFRDTSTVTENKRVVKKNTMMMTDVIDKYDRCSQTPIAPPRRRRKRASDILNHINNDKNYENASSTEDTSVSPVIRINISQQYAADADIQSSDDSLSDKTVNDKHTSATITPDLLTNHNTGDTNILDDPIGLNTNVDNVLKHAKCINEEIPKEETIDFPDSEDHLLPRVTIVSTKTATEEDLKDIILGRNSVVYPYNIVYSPQKEREECKRTVKFRDCQTSPNVTTGRQRFHRNQQCHSEFCMKSTCLTGFESEIRKNQSSRESQVTLSDSDSSKAESNSSFVWEKVTDGKTKETSSWTYTPVYKSKTKYNTAKAKIYREFLGLENEEINSREYQQNYSSSHDLSDRNENDYQHTFNERRQFFEDKFKFRDFPRKSFYDFSTIERNLLDSCNSLDAAVNKYGSYLAEYHGHGKVANKTTSRTPTEYLQHLVQVRRDLVNECDATDSSSTRLSCN